MSTAVDRLGRVRVYLASPSGRNEAPPETAEDVARLEARMAAPPAKPAAERAWPGFTAQGSRRASTTR